MTDDTALVVGILADALDVPVSTEVPQQRPQRFVMVSLTGDTSTQFIHSVRYGLTVWGTTDADAHGLAMSAWHALADAAQDHELLSAVGLDSMSRDEWTATGAARYLVQLDLIINT